MSQRRKDWEQTASARSVLRDAADEMRADDALRRVSTECDTIEDLVRRVCEQFNEMRSELAAFLRICRGFGRESPKFAETLKAVAHGDYGNLLAKYRAEKSQQMPAGALGVVVDVEEAGGFAAAVMKIMDMVKPETRMLACIDVNDRIAGAIASWQSKIDKMGVCSTASGSSPAEAETAARQAEKFGIVVDILRKRGGQVSEIYLDAQRQLDAFRAECKDRFKAIFFRPR